MKLETAIKRLMLIQADLDMANETEDIDALQLGIEALEALASERQRLHCDFYMPLPGETKE